MRSLLPQPGGFEGGSAERAVSAGQWSSMPSGNQWQPAIEGFELHHPANWSRSTVDAKAIPVLTDGPLVAPRHRAGEAVHGVVGDLDRFVVGVVRA